MDKGNIRASIIGVGGYTGLELLRLLIAHPFVEIAYLTARSVEGETPIGELAPHLAGYDYAVTNAPHSEVAANSDVVFLCLPHKATAEIIPDIIGQCKIIDLSADFRLKDASVYKETYGLDHPCPELLKEFTYGLPEIYRDNTKGAENVANPGCFALLTQLLLYPFRANIKAANVMAVTGSSGLGKTPSEGGHHPVRAHNMKSYGVNAHRHMPEILQTLDMKAARLNFVPTSGPFVRGIFATAFVALNHAQPEPHKIYEGQPFIRIKDAPALADVTGSNFADLSFRQGHDDRSMIAQGVIDNLMKGASGTAVQNMNLMFGVDEGEGLMTLSPLYP